MGSPSGCSIASGRLSLCQPTFSRNAIGRSIFRHSRPGTPIPEHVPPRSYASPHCARVRRPPRFKPGRRQHYIPPLVQETQYQLPWRAERQRQQQRFQASSAYSSGRVRSEETRSFYHRHPVSSAEGPGYAQRTWGREPEREGYQGYHHHHHHHSGASPAEGIRFPERRPHRTRHTSEEQWRDAAFHDTEPGRDRRRGSSSSATEYSRYPYDHDHTHYRSIHQPRGYPPLPSPSYTTRYDYHDSAYTMHPLHPTSNRWSFSSDSSAESGDSGLRWSPSSPTLYSPTPTLPAASLHRPRSRGLGLRHAPLEMEPRWGRHSEVVDIQGWMVEDVSTPHTTSSDELESSSTSLRTPSPEEADMGQTVVYTGGEAIVRDPRFTPPHEQTRTPNGLDRAVWAKQEEETKRRKRVYAFPMWAESPPRHMRGQQREGIRYRFRRGAPEDAPSLPKGRHDHQVERRSNFPCHPEPVESARFVDR